MNITIIAVVYNQTLESCESWKTLLRPAASSSGLSAAVYVADNSTIGELRTQNRHTAEAAGAVYLDMQGNQGLPKAYNRAIRESGKDRTDDWIVFADQDTIFPENYLQLLRQAAEGSAADVLAPIVRAEAVRISPCRKKAFRFVPPEAGLPEKEELQDAFFVNSGLAVRRRFFSDGKVGYDEALFLDFTDHDLICQIRARTDAVFGCIPDAVLEQRFSGAGEVRTAAQDLERFRHFVHDGRIFYEKWYSSKEAAAAIRFRALRLAAKHRDIRFLKKI